MGLSKDRETRYGQILGTLANDATQDHTRSLWWLLNASQAVGNVTAEAILSKANPDLYKYHTKKFKEFEETQWINWVSQKLVQKRYSKSLQYKIESYY